MMTLVSHAAPLAPGAEVAALTRSRNRTVAGSLVVAASLVILFAASFALCIHNNDFPVVYHVDDPMKAEQIVQNTRNFNHPLLMLEATQLAARLLGTPKDMQLTVQLGRSVNAAFAAGAACVLALLGFRMWGFAGLALCGVAVGLCPPLVVYAHYMKEDPSLLLGIALALLAARLVWERRGRGQELRVVAFLGAACGVAASGKYVGVVMLPMALAIVTLAFPLRAPRTVLRAGLLLIAFVTVAAAINHRAVANFSSLVQRISAEEKHATTLHDDLTMSRPTLFHAASFARQCMPHVWLLSAVFAVKAIARCRRDAWDLCIVAFAGVYLFVLSWSVLPFYRYPLPVIVTAHLAAGLAVAGLCEQIERLGLRTVATTLAIAVFAALQLPRCLDCVHQFGDDSRVRLRQWVTANLPPDAVVLRDDHVRLDERLTGSAASAPIPSVRLLGDCAAPQAGDLDHLRREGVEYVAVTDTRYAPYFDPFIRPAPGTRTLYDYQLNWYEGLFRDEELVWSSEPLHPMFSTYNNPTIRLYRLRPRGGIP